MCIMMSPSPSRLVVDGCTTTCCSLPSHDFLHIYDVFMILLAFVLFEILRFDFDFSTGSTTTYVECILK
jgi:hypothetical protein